MKDQGRMNTFTRVRNEDKDIMKRDCRHYGYAWDAS